MFEFMAIQIVAIALIFLFPVIATSLPDYLLRSAALVVSEPPAASTSSSRMYGLKTE